MTLRQTITVPGFTTITNSIKLQWRNPRINKNDQIELVIKTSNSTQKTILDAPQESYLYTRGKHGELYWFEVRIKNSEGSLSVGQKISAMFLDWEPLPNLPLISVETKNGVMPTATYVDHPENCMGSTAVDTDYVAGQLTMKTGNTVSVYSSAEIRIRGNTSAFHEKKPYKIKLDHAIDLLGRNNPIYKDTEWILLAADRFLRTETGFKVAEICEQEWVPQYLTVNLMINGNWMGCYNLVESVKKSPGRLNIADTGFSVEKDAYSWAEESPFIHHIVYNFERTAYTIEYPDKNISERIEPLEEYLTNYDKALILYEGDFIEYIDLDSFATWLLVHDIMDTYDCGGSNTFLYKNSLDLDDPTDKLKIGPNWDFDSCFSRYYLVDGNKWSRFHEAQTFKRLFSDNRFLQCYKEKWELVSPSITQEIEFFLNDYITKNNEALQKSWDLDSTRWGTEQFSAEEISQIITEGFSDRTAWLDQMIRSF